VPALWARNRDDELRVPIGVTAPASIDLRSQGRAEAGWAARPDDRHDRLRQVANPDGDPVVAVDDSLADRLIVIYADFKGEAGADSFRNFPQVVAVISNMAEKKSLADRFADTLRGEVARRECSCARPAARSRAARSTR